MTKSMSKLMTKSMTKLMIKSMTKYTTNILLHDHPRKPINDQNVGCVIRYCKLANNCHIYANFSHRLKPIND